MLKFVPGLSVLVGLKLPLGAVVVYDVPESAVVAGVPTKIAKYR